jgi:hypothetical protein
VPQIKVIICECGLYRQARIKCGGLLALLRVPFSQETFKIEVFRIA